MYKRQALERISNFVNTKQKFTSKDTDFEKPYENAVGMFTDGKAEKIVLQFDSRDGNYLKSNPIHHSQKVKEIENGVELKLFVKPTLDFIMAVSYTHLDVYKRQEHRNLIFSKIIIWYEIRDTSFEVTL